MLEAPERLKMKHKVFKIEIGVAKKAFLKMYQVTKCNTIICFQQTRDNSK